MWKDTTAMTKVIDSQTPFPGSTNQLLRQNLVKLADEYTPKARQFMKLINTYSTLHSTQSSFDFSHAFCRIVGSVAKLRISRSSSPLKNKIVVVATDNTYHRALGSGIDWSHLNVRRSGIIRF